MTTTRRRWALVEADLGHPVGHEQGLRRPVLIVSNEAFNRVSGLLTALPITSVKPGRSPQPFEVFLAAGAAGNPVDSIVLPDPHDLGRPHPPTLWPLDRPGTATRSGNEASRAPRPRRSSTGRGRTVNRSACHSHCASRGASLARLRTLFPQSGGRFSSFSAPETMLTPTPEHRFAYVAARDMCF